MSYGRECTTITVGVHHGNALNDRALILGGLDKTAGIIYYCMMKVLAATYYQGSVFQLSI